MNNQYNENEEDEGNKELIYQEESGYQNVEKLFNDESDESAIYEIEFKIFDKQFKNVQILLIKYILLQIKLINLDTLHKSRIGEDKLP